MGRVGCITCMLTHHKSVHAQTAFENAPSFVLDLAFSQRCLEPLYVRGRRPKRVLEAIGYAIYRQLRITQMLRLTLVILYGVHEIFSKSKADPMSSLSQC